MDNLCYDMHGLRIRPKHIALFFALVAIDVFVYLVLGLLSMAYDDNYDGSKGPYWSWQSMSTFDKAVMVGANFWHLVNVAAIAYFLYRFYKQWQVK